MLFTLCSPHSDEDSVPLLQKTMELPRKQLEAVSAFTGLCREFLDKKLIQWPLRSEKQLMAHPVFDDQAAAVYNKSVGESTTGGFEVSCTGGKARWDMLRKRVVQHNIRILSLYYDRVTVARMMSLLKLERKVSPVGRSQARLYAASDSALG